MRRAILAFVALGVGIGSATSAGADIFDCNVATVAAFSDRTHVSCSPADGLISYFAVPASQRDLASRLLAVGLVAQVTGGGLNIYFDPADTSGSSVGCQAGNCRVITGVEARPITPLADNTGRAVGALAAVVAPEPGAPLEALAVGSVLAALLLRRRLE
jgi:hypothetical protein